MTAYTGGERVDALLAVPETPHHCEPSCQAPPPPMPSGSVTLEAARSQGGATRRWRAAESVAGARPVPATHPGASVARICHEALAWSGLSGRVAAVGRSTKRPERSTTWHERARPSSVRVLIADDGPNSRFSTDVRRPNAKRQIQQMLAGDMDLRVILGTRDLATVKAHLGRIFRAP